ncbi:MAG: glycosyltransferase family 2 protein [Candidatus Marinimicrobia bacterium]|nr:glycosyltransferase family 2 protein [Candidatus Neomarinimicrobiota bacterium]
MEILNKKISAILFHGEKFSYGPEEFGNIMKSLKNQSRVFEDVIIIADGSPDLSQCKMDHVSVRQGNLETLSAELKKAVKACKGDYVVLIDNLTSEINLKQAYNETMLLTMARKPRAGLVYADYDLKTISGIQEKHLLKHHIGRVRDNMDFGKVLFVPKALLAESIDESVRYKTWYDLRLRISEKAELVHLANRYSGSLYTVVAPSTSANVFDYLLASKESQLEAEIIVTEHLKRIGAYLAPQQNYHRRPEKNTELAATVIIPVGRRPEFIGAALESVFGQTVQNIEVIVVVNGGVDDPTIPEVKKYMEGGEKYDGGKPPVRLKVVDVNNIGLCLNLGTEMAKGKYYVQLDSDDRLKPDAVKKVIQLFESDENIGMVIGSYEVWELKDNGDYNRMKEIPVVTHDEWTEDNGRNNLLRINGAGAPRCIPFTVIQEIGYFDMNDTPFARNYGEDYDMVNRIAEQYKIGRIFDPIYEVVRHSGGTDHNIDESTVNRNDEAKDQMRMETVHRRIKINQNK